MATTIFKLKEPKSKEPTLIYMYFNFNYAETDYQGNKRYIPLKYSTGLKIAPRYWNDKPDYRAKETKNFPEYPEFNQRLKDLDSTVNKIYLKLVNGGVQVTPKLLRKELDIFLEREAKPLQTNLVGFIERLITDGGASKRPRTLMKYKTTLKHLQNFSKNRGFTLEFNNIDLDFYMSFLDYLIKDLLFTENTAGKYIKTLKTFLNEATDRGLNTKLDYRKKRFRSPSEEVEKIYLSDAELLKLHKHDFTNNLRLERVRDMFILESYLGLRYSDIVELKPENFYNTPKGKILKIRTTKTGEIVAIPLHWIANEIIDKYSGQLPRMISNQKMNDYLKEIGKLAELDEMVETKQKKGGMVVSKTQFKYELLTTHCARRSFATNLYLAGIPSISIMKITGHRTERSFLQYIRISQEENALKLLGHPYFAKNSNLKVVTK